MTAKPLPTLLLYLIAITAATAMSHLKLNHIPPGGSAVIRMRENTVYPDCHNVRVSGDRLNCWFHGRQMEFERKEILRVMIKGKTYSDLETSVIEDALQNSPPAQLTKGTDDFEGCRKTLTPENIDTAAKAGARGCIEAIKFTGRAAWPVNFFGTISTPVNLFPFTGLAIGSNFFNEINFGLGAGISGPYVTAGIYYAQAHIYLNYRISPANYIGFKMGIRSIAILTPARSEETAANSPNYFSTFTTATLTQYSMPIYYGWQRTSADSIEVGIDIGIPINSTVSFNDQDLSDAAKNSKVVQTEIQRKKADAAKVLDTYEKITWIYVAYVHRF